MLWNRCLQVQARLSSPAARLPVQLLPRYRAPGRVKTMSACQSSKTNSHHYSHASMLSALVSNKPGSAQMHSTCGGKTHASSTRNMQLGWDFFWRALGAMLVRPSLILPSLSWLVTSAAAFFTCARLLLSWYAVWLTNALKSTASVVVVCSMSPG